MVLPSDIVSKKNGSGKSGLLWFDAFDICDWPTCYCDWSTSNLWLIY